MSAAAEAYYPGRAQDLQLPVPVHEVLDGKPHDVLAGEAGMPPSDVVQAFEGFIEPVEAYVIGGIPKTYTMLGERYTRDEWMALINFLPRYRSLPTVGRYVRRHLAPFADRMRDDGADQIWLEAFTRDELPSRAFKTATNTRPYYTRDEFEPSQAYLLAWAVGNAGCAQARLTLIQGVYETFSHKDDEFITPRYGGCNLLPEEIYDLGIGR
jgi:hypothetical protein